jgi:acetyl esterase/lipase
MNKIRVIFLLAVILVSNKLLGQEYINLWPEGKMPNSKGLSVRDSISNERYFRVGTPGMFAFFPSKQQNKGAAVVICPGGGYYHYSYILSGTEIAKWFNTMGISAFVLISRFPHSPDLIERSKAPLQDAQRAVRMIRANAQQWGIKPDKIGIIGFSAGGHLASTLGTHMEDVSNIGDSLRSISFRPDFMLLISPVISMGEYAHEGSRSNLFGEKPSKELIEKYSNELQVTSQTPPAFIALADNDNVVNPMNSVLFYNAMHSKNISVSLHIFPHGGHALGLLDNPGSTGLWVELCKLWITEMEFMN